MTEINLPADTQAILLLCGHFGGKDQDARPLTLTEYNRLAAWLRQEKLRPADLLSREAEQSLATFARGHMDPERLRRLLERGVELGFVVEEWTRQGLWVMSRGEEAYPRRLKKRLRESAPALLFGAGDRNLMDSGGLGMVGSRDADEHALDLARRIGRQSSEEGITIISGGARGIDQESMLATLDSGGHAVAVLAEGVARPAVSRQYRRYLSDGHLVLVSPYFPGARWTTGSAMGRNKFIYALSDWALVVSSGTDGGTWTGALENLKNHWTPMLARIDDFAPEGNKKLVEMGALPLHPDSLGRATSLLGFLQGLSTSTLSGDGTGDLFVAADEPPQGVPLYSTPTGKDREEGTTADTSMVSEPASLEAGFPVAGSLRKPDTPAIGELFTVVWPSLALAFEEEVTEDHLNEVATRYDIQPGQLRVWVRKAVALGLLEKRTRPTRFRRT